MTYEELEFLRIVGDVQSSLNSRYSQLRWRTYRSGVYGAQAIRVSYTFTKNDNMYFGSYILGLHDYSFIDKESDSLADDYADMIFSSIRETYEAMRDGD